MNNIITKVSSILILLITSFVLIPFQMSTINTVVYIFLTTFQVFTVLLSMYFLAVERKKKELTSSSGLFFKILIVVLTVLLTLFILVYDMV